MNITEAKQIVLNECQREKRIVVRNFIVMAVLFFAIVFCALFFFSDIVSNIIQNFMPNTGDETANTYYKIVVPLVFSLVLLSPVFNLVRVTRRAKKAEKAFELLSSGNECQIIGTEEKFLTTIPLGKIKYQLNPVTYLYIAIQNKNYDLPVPDILVPDLKRALSDGDAESYEAIMDELYGETSTQAKHTEHVPLKSTEEFNSFANKELAPILDAMESGRSKTASSYYFQIIAIFLFVGGFIYYGVINPPQNANGTLIMVGGFIGFSSLLSLMFYLRMKKTATSGESFTDFKKRVFSQLIKFVNPNFQYFEKAHIGLPEFLHSGLFREEYYSISGGDQIVGHHNGVPFQSCNLSVSFRPNLRNEKDPDDTVFYGNYFVARFPKKFIESVYIVPKKGFFSDIKDNEIGSYLDVHAGTERIRLEDPEFAKQFEVYCNDQVMARYVLSTTLMERLKEVNQRCKGNVYFSINDSNIVVATNRSNVTNDVDGLIGAMFTKLDMKIVTEMYAEIVDQLKMIETLKLNNDIWKP